jgi:prepilin-type processing-associated H-X9-DG protein
MSLTRRVKNAISPWLAFAALSAVDTGVYSAVVLAGFTAILGISSLAHGELTENFHSTAFIILRWVVISLECGLSGVLMGFWVGAVSSLVGGAAGRWWSFLAFLGIMCLLPPLPHEFDGLFFILLPQVLLAIACAKFADDLMDWRVPRFKWHTGFRRRMQGSWLQDPPYVARFFGLFLPLVCGFLIWPVAVATVFWNHRDYVSHLGISGTWRQSELWAQWQNRDHWKRSTCQSNLKQIMLGVIQYEQDYDELLPTPPHSASQGVAAVIQPYVKSTQLFQCPQDFMGEGNDQFANGGFTDYWFNSRLYGLNLSNFSHGSSTIAWGEGNTGAGEANAAYSLSSIPTNFAPATRHLNGANYAFMDGHVKWFHQGEVSNTASASISHATMNP